MRFGLEPSEAVTKNPIRALANPRNLHFRFLSRQWREELDLDNSSTVLMDGEQFIAETRDFPDGTIREIRLASSATFRRCEPGGEWTCVAGERFGQRFGEIEFVLELCDNDGPYFQCACLNVIAHNVVYLDL